MPYMKTILLICLVVSLLLNILLFNKWLTKKDIIPSTEYEEVKFAFSDLVNNPKTLLLDSIYQAKSTLDIAIYNIEDRDILKAVLAANKRDVVIRVITDAKKASKKKRAKILDELVENNIDVKINTKRKMHLKMAIIDESLIVTGSYNYTEASAYDNLEQLLTLSGEELGKEWTAIFKDLWEQEEFEYWSR